MEQIKRYVECYIPITTCNLNCGYCYITRQQKWKDEIIPIGHSADEIAKALSKKRLGGTCLINICGGGETLLCPGITEVIRALLEEGHFVMVVNNGTITKVLKQIAEFPGQLLNHLIFKFSYHYLELHRLGLVNMFFDNIRMMRKAGCSFTLEITPNDELVPYIEDVKREAEENVGAVCHVTIARDDITDSIDIMTSMSEEEFYKTWEQFDSPLFDFKKTIFGKRQNYFCYAGEWSVYVHLGTGIMTQCYAGKELDNIYDDVDRPLHFCAIGTKCPFPHCYNGHAFLSLGDMPEKETPCYGSLRNRVDKDGNEWLTEEMKLFLSGKLSDSNKEYSKMKKWLIEKKK